MYSKFIERLREAEKSIPLGSKKDYIPFPVIFEKVCRNFSLKKDDAFEILFMLRDFGFIEVVPFHGIKLKYEVKNV